jgi:hypothetical protein
MRLAPMIASFVQGAGGIVANRVRIVPDDVAFSYGAAFDEVPAPVPSGDGRSRIDLAQLPRAQGLDGTFDVYITGRDARGNESDPLTIDDALFDFAAPDAPTDGRIDPAE